MSAKAKITGFMAALMVLSVPLVYADNPAVADDSTSHKEWCHEPGQMTAKILNLTEDQQKQLKDLWRKSRQAHRAFFDQIKANREALEAEIIKASPDMNKVTDLQNQLKGIQAQMTDEHLNSLLAAKKILTPGQFAGFMALQKEHKLRMMHIKHRLGHRRPWGKDASKGWGNKDKYQDDD